MSRKKQEFPTQLFVVIDDDGFDTYYTAYTAEELKDMGVESETPLATYVLREVRKIVKETRIEPL